MKVSRLFQVVFAGVGVVLLVGSLRMVALSAGPAPEYEEVFSPLYQLFDAASLAPPGSTPEDVKQVNNWNSESLRGNRELHGTIDFKVGTTTTVDVFRTVQEAVHKVTNKYSVGGANPSLPADAEPIRNDGKSPTYAMWMYNWEKRHGELRVWLFPYPDGTKIGFAVHLMEETAIDEMPDNVAESADEFIQLRGQVLDELQQKLDSNIPGATLRDKQKEKIRFEKTPEENERDRKEFAKGEWQAHSSHQWILNLSEDALLKGLQGNSETMYSTQLLNHYCEGLKQFGFRNRGTPSVVVSAVQCSSNEWFREGHRQQLSISAIVFVAPSDHRAIVRIEIREAWPK